MNKNNGGNVSSEPRRRVTQAETTHWHPYRQALRRETISLLKAAFGARKTHEDTAKNTGHWKYIPKSQKIAQIAVDAGGASLKVR